MLKNIRCFVTLLFCLIAVNSTALEIIRKNLDLPGWKTEHRDLKIMYITDLHLREEVISAPLFTKDLPDAIKKEKPHLQIAQMRFIYATSFVPHFTCGAKEVRTPDLLHAMETRYQLRHSPKQQIRLYTLIFRHANYACRICATVVCCTGFSRLIV